MPSVAVVFTGHPERILLGLKLIEEGIVERLFITGVNLQSGLTVDGFAEQFRLTPKERSWLEDGKVVLAEDATSTLENALETRCWLQSHPEFEAVVLITSSEHMPRASIALEHAIYPARVFRMFSDMDSSPAHTSLEEIFKFTTTHALTLLPPAFWPVRSHIIAGCAALSPRKD